MKFFSLIPYYFAWHYTTAIAELVSVWGNYLWFTLNYFSVRILFTSMFKPFRRIKESTTLKDFEGELKIVTLLNMFFGFLIRFMSLCAGIFSLFLIIVVGLISFIIWVFLPFFLLLILGIGIGSMINAKIS